jgi:hypothetical protein
LQQVVKIENEIDLLSFTKMLKFASFGHCDRLEPPQGRHRLGQDLPLDPRPIYPATQMMAYYLYLIL